MSIGSKFFNFCLFEETATGAGAALMAARRRAPASPNAPDDDGEKDSATKERRKKFKLRHNVTLEGNNKRTKAKARSPPGGTDPTHIRGPVGQCTFLIRQ